MRLYFECFTIFQMRLIHRTALSVSISIIQSIKSRLPTHTHFFTTTTITTIIISFIERKHTMLKDGRHQQHNNIISHIRIEYNLSLGVHCIQHCRALLCNITNDILYQFLFNTNKIRLNLN